MANNDKGRVFGHIPGTTVGQIFADRVELAKAGIHKPTQAGISGSAKEGSDSIVLSGGYEDDEDFGNVIIYTGAGGKEHNAKVQTFDQQLSTTNLALARSHLEGYPVRVSRSLKHKDPKSTEKGYEYAGLYKVDDYWQEKGRSGFYVWRYRLIACDEQPTQEAPDEPSNGHTEARRVQTTVQRIVRDTKIAKRVKQLHNYQCQVCGIALETSAGLYAEAAHIKPLGQPHNGPDVESNILCLCPNHHVLFDNGGFTISDDLKLIGIEGELKTVTRHTVDLAFIQYHHEHYHMKR
ncbi:putative restriction endonuclease [Marinomonas polaris DSM 16579]|uniref:Putative restriction endonuclease n=1 Tax=Marinomonas polaris DSM 16579 TaxID=1122206 RepID=A0A1M5I4L0_9GAMM|nr:YDG/SRA domain-containing protein [Marinomonas polaris]SHG23039.1 putative restriction endonuclease [Marinomonas polaris DSM 16579]